MYNPDFKTVENLSNIKKSLEDFNKNFNDNYDSEDELDAQLKTMLDLIFGGFTSVYEEMKRRL